MASFGFASVLITGANRGLGLAMIKYLLNLPKGPTQIIATCRSLQAENAQELNKIAKTNSNVHVLELDMANISGRNLTDFTDQVAHIVKDAGLNLLINNAGILDKVPNSEMSVESLRNIFSVNTIAPCMITKALHPFLKQAAQVNRSHEQTVAAVVNISSSIGSISDTTSSYCMAYRISKAGLNMFTKATSCEYSSDDIAVVSLHPGWVKTDMGGKQAPLTVDESVSGMMNVILSLKKSDSGSFLKYDGTILPW